MDPESRVTSHGIRIGQSDGIRIESGIKCCHILGIRNQNLELKFGISDEKIYLVTTLILNSLNSPGFLFSILTHINRLSVLLAVQKALCTRAQKPAWHAVQKNQKKKKTERRPTLISIKTENPMYLQKKKKNK